MDAGGRADQACRNGCRVGGYLREQYEAMVADIHQPDSGHFVNGKHGFIKAGSFWLEKVA